jgi:hypothetical protein
MLLGVMSTVLHTKPYDNADAKANKAVCFIVRKDSIYSSLSERSSLVNAIQQMLCPHVDLKASRTRRVSLLTVRYSCRAIICSTWRYSRRLCLLIFFSIIRTRSRPLLALSPSHCLPTEWGRLRGSTRPTSLPPPWPLR